MGTGKELTATFSEPPAHHPLDVLRTVETDGRRQEEKCSAYHIRDMPLGKDNNACGVHIATLGVHIAMLGVHLATLPPGQLSAGIARISDKAKIGIPYALLSALLYCLLDLWQVGRHCGLRVISVCWSYGMACIPRAVGCFETD